MSGIVFNCKCCNAGASSYVSWLVHLTTKEHQDKLQLNWEKLEAELLNGSEFASKAITADNISFDIPLIDVAKFFSTWGIVRNLVYKGLDESLADIFYQEDGPTMRCILVMDSEEIVNKILKENSFYLSGKLIFVNRLFAPNRNNGYDMVDRGMDFSKPALIEIEDDFTEDDHDFTELKKPVQLIPVAEYYKTRIQLQKGLEDSKSKELTEDLEDKKFKKVKDDFSWEMDTENESDENEDLNYSCQEIKKGSIRMSQTLRKYFEKAVSRIIPQLLDETDESDTDDVDDNTITVVTPKEKEITVDAVNKLINVDGNAKVSVEEYYEINSREITENNMTDTIKIVKSLMDTVEMVESLMDIVEIGEIPTDTVEIVESAMTNTLDMNVRLNEGAEVQMENFNPIEIVDDNNLKIHPSYAELIGTKTVTEDKIIIEDEDGFVFVIKKRNANTTLSKPIPIPESSSEEETEDESEKKIKNLRINVRKKFQTLWLQYLIEFNSKFWTELFGFIMEAYPDQKIVPDEYSKTDGIVNQLTLKERLQTIPSNEEGCYLEFRCETRDEICDILYKKKVWKDKFVSFHLRPLWLEISNLANKKAEEWDEGLESIRMKTYIPFERRLEINCKLEINFDLRSEIPKNGNLGTRAVIHLTDLSYSKGKKLRAKKLHFLTSMYAMLGMKYVNMRIKEWLDTCKDFDFESFDASFQKQRKKEKGHPKFRKFRRKWKQLGMC